MTDERVSMDGDSVDAGTVSPAPARRRSLLPLLILTLLAFALGVGLTVWAWPQIQSRVAASDFVSRLLLDAEHFP